MLRCAILTWLAQLGCTARVKQLSQNAGWPLFEPDNCGYCGGEAIATLKDSADQAVGCISKNGPGLAMVPPCQLKGTSDQAGGHAGTIEKLENGLLAKMTQAFDTGEDGTAKAKIEVGAVEYSIYMEMWCLQKLSSRMSELSEDLQATIASHSLRKFALGDDPWAPSFHGVCKVEENGTTNLFLVMEDMLDKYQQPCQLDLKLGYATVEPDNLASIVSDSTSWGDKIAKAWKKVRHEAGDAVTSTLQQGVRPAGYKIFNPFTQQSEKPSSKVAAATTPMHDVINTMFDISGHQDDLETLQIFKDRLLSMAGWWGAVGQDKLRTVALSVLMAYECAPPSQEAGTISISNITLSVENKQPSWKGQPYLVLGSFPKRKLYPATSVLAGRPMTPTSIQRMGGMYKSAKAASWNSPTWDGLQFAVHFADSVSELVIEIWSTTAGPMVKYVGRANIPVSTMMPSWNKQCVAVQMSNEKDIRQWLCFEAQRIFAKPQMAPIAKPSVKLIDYAHFYTSDENPGWPRDGAYEGLLSVIKYLDVKELEGDGRSWEDGQNWKCDRPANEFCLSSASCHRLGIEMHRKYITWRPSQACGSLFECRLCDVLTRRQKTPLMTERLWLIFRNDNFAIEK